MSMDQSQPQASPRIIPDKLGTPFRRIMASWEVLLLGVAILIFIANSLASPTFSTPGTSLTPPSTSPKRR